MATRKYARWFDGYWARCMAPRRTTTRRLGDAVVVPWTGRGTHDGHSRVVSAIRKRAKATGVGISHFSESTVAEGCEVNAYFRRDAASSALFVSTDMRIVRADGQHVVACGSAVPPRQMVCKPFRALAI